MPTTLHFIEKWPSLLPVFAGNLFAGSSAIELNRNKQLNSVNSCDGSLPGFIQKVESNRIHSKYKKEGATEHGAD